MVQTAFFSAFNFIANNKWAQIALTAGLILIAYKWQAEHHEARGRRQANARSEKKARRVLTKIERRSNERLEQADTARDTVRDVRNFSELPKSIRDALQGTGERGPD